MWDRFITQQDNRIMVFKMSRGSILKIGEAPFMWGIFLFVSLLALMPHMALAQSAGGVGGVLTTDTTTQINPIITFVIDLMFLIGLILIAGGLFKIVEAQNDGGRTSIKVPIIIILVGAAMMALVAVSGVGIGTIFSGGTGGSRPTVGTLSVN
jgi:nitrogen fixation/metabolism regulation signal transduction histidine kinase